MGKPSIADRMVTFGRWPAGKLGTVAAWMDTALETVTPYFAHEARLLALTPDDAFLDVACGTGVFLQRRAAHVHKVAGIDQSTTQIAMARRLLRDRLDAGTADLVEGDVTELPWPDGTSSAVLCNCVDCFPVKQRQAFREMYRVLRPGMLSAAGFTDVTVARLPTLVTARRPE